MKLYKSLNFNRNLDYQSLLNKRVEFYSDLIARRFHKKVENAIDKKLVAKEMYQRAAKGLWEVSSDAVFYFGEEIVHDFFKNQTQKGISILNTLLRIESDGKEDLSDEILFQKRPSVFSMNKHSRQLLVDTRINRFAKILAYYHFLKENITDYSDDIIAVFALHITCGYHLGMSVDKINSELYEIKKPKPLSLRVEKKPIGREAEFIAQYVTNAIRNSGTPKNSHYQQVIALNQILKNLGQSDMPAINKARLLAFFNDGNIDNLRKKFNDEWSRENTDTKIGDRKVVLELLNKIGLEDSTQAIKREIDKLE